MSGPEDDPSEATYDTDLMIDEIKALQDKLGERTHALHCAIGLSQTQTFPTAEMLNQWRVLVGWQGLSDKFISENNL